MGISKGSIRGIRDSIAGYTIVGRLGSGNGPPVPIPLSAFFADANVLMALQGGAGLNNLPKGTTTVYGVVKFDGTTIVLNGSNQLSAVQQTISNGTGLLVNGDTPGPAFLTDPDGQCIGVDL